MIERAPKYFRDRFDPERTIWDDDRFKSYLLALKDPKNIERRENFPDVIKPMVLFHDAAKEIDKQTFIRGIEMYSLIGTSKNKGKLVIQTVPTPGEIDHIPNETAFKVFKKSNHNNLDVLLGDLHSHPSGVAEQSRGDHFSLLQKSSLTATFGGVVVNGRMSVVFKSWQTEKMLDLKILPDSKLDFMRKWYGFANQREMNNAIAHRYSLVRYKGCVGGPLYKNFPRYG